jgi:hypothetical protein
MREFKAIGLRNVNAAYSRASLAFELGPPPVEARLTDDGGDERQRLLDLTSCCLPAKCHEMSSSLDAIPVILLGICFGDAKIPSI